MTNNFWLHAVAFGWALAGYAIALYALGRWIEDKKKQWRRGRPNRVKRRRAMLTFIARINLAIRNNCETKRRNRAERKVEEMRRRLFTPSVWKGTHYAAH